MPRRRPRCVFWALCAAAALPPAAVAPAAELPTTRSPTAAPVAEPFDTLVAPAPAVPVVAAAKRDAVGPCDGAGLTPESVLAATPECIGGLPAAAWAGVGPDVVAAIRPAAFARLSPAACAAFDRHQGAVLRPEQVGRISAGCFGAMSTDCLQAMKAGAFAAVPPGHIAALSGDAAETMRSGEALAGMTVAQCMMLRAETCSSMEGDWLSKVHPSTCAGMNPGCFRAIGCDPDGLPPACLAQLPPRLFSQFPKVGKFCSVPLSVLQNLTADRVRAIPRGVCSAACLRPTGGRTTEALRAALQCGGSGPKRSLAVRWTAKAADPWPLRPYSRMLCLATVVAGLALLLLLLRVRRRGSEQSAVFTYSELP
eukprot:TRINITY_DN5729_c1_g1_i1.p1 TRINITY_DN5729_c1_g1~~TRINITY_DN5729_c1_g1_i1.p1  ORF type:complete len:368 (+),score=105.96 TRINITY_DN5729_c1_g1_i1:59-1162(+)